MKPPKSYSNPGSFRAAFLRKVPPRFQKLAVMQRYALRVCRHIPHAVVKGGVGLELRLKRAWTTQDVDFVISGDPRKTLPMLQEAGRIDLGDFLTFQVREDRSSSIIDTPGMHYAGARFHVKAAFGTRPDGHSFAIETTYARVEHYDEVHCRLEEFPQIEGGDLRLYPLTLQLAEKIHAYTDPNIRDDPKHSRYRDLVDIGLIAEACSVRAEGLAADLTRTFEDRRASARKQGVELQDLPSSLPPPPEPWGELYERFAQKEGLRWKTSQELVSEAKAFLDPVLASDVADGSWDPEQHAWVR